MYVVVIGIDRYRRWGPLHNAVGDARGARDAFVKLGFEQACEPLFDEAATGEALQRLVKDRLRILETNDSLVLFFAGHGHTVTSTFADETCTKTGYLIPVDAEHHGESISTWLCLDSWLDDVARLPPKHILVILDACHSGIALAPIIRWRGADIPLPEPLEALRTRRSRRILTSSLDDQLAMDGGPVEGHSLFTGCLIEALTGGVVSQTGQRHITGSEIWRHVQHRVTTYPGSRQTPDFGAFAHHDHGDLVVMLPGPDEPGSVAEIVETTRARGPRATARARSRSPRTAEHSPGAAGRSPSPGVAGPRPAPTANRRPARVGSRTPAPDPWRHSPSYQAGSRFGQPNASPRGPALDATFIAALDRHEVERLRGANVLSIIAADSMTALTAWATWAAHRGRLTLVTEATSLDAAIEQLLGQAPWLRSVPAARARLAEAAHLDVEAVDAALDARSGVERETWIDDVAGLDRGVRVSGWLLSALQQPSADVPDLTTAPVRGGELLTILCELAAPIAVLVHHPEPTASWISRAIPIAAVLAGYLPRHAVAVGAPSELVTRVLTGDRESAALSMARQGVVRLATPAQRSSDQLQSRPAQVLHDALMRDPRTAGLFVLGVKVPIHEVERSVDVDLVASAAQLAVEVDGWYHSRDPQSYRHARVKDVWLQRAGFFVMRFPAEDVEQRLKLIIDEIAIVLGARRTAQSFQEVSHDKRA